MLIATLSFSQVSIQFVQGFKKLARNIALEARNSITTGQSFANFHTSVAV